MKIGFYVNTTGSKLISYAEYIRKLNFNITVFKNIAIPTSSNIKMPIFDAADAYQFDGIMIVDSIKTCEVAKEFPLIKSMVFAILEQEWTNRPMTYSYLKGILQNKDIDIWILNNRIKNSFTKSWGSPKEIIENELQFGQAIRRMVE